MKIVKVRIRRGDEGQEMMVYPARYRAQEVDRNGLGPLNVNQSNAYSGHIARGGKTAWCLIILDDDLADEYATDANMAIITPIVADALMEEWRVAKGETEEVVQDVSRITAIAAKQAASLPLTDEDLKALDPEDSVPGVNKRLARKMVDLLPTLGV